MMILPIICSKVVNRAGVPASTLTGKALDKMDYDVQAAVRPDRGREKRNARTKLFSEVAALGGRLEGGCPSSSGCCWRIGSGFRGGNWNNSESNLRVSDRNNAANTNTDRNNNYGFRLVRTHSISKLGGGWVAQFRAVWPPHGEEVAMKVIDNIYPTIVDTENLYGAVKRAAAGKRSHPDVAGFLLNQEENVEELRTELEAMTYRPGRYRQFLLREPKERLVSAAPFRDRVVHHAIHDVIEPIIDRSFIHDSYACRKGKGTHRALARAQHFLRSNDYVLHLDIRRYFESIDHAVLISILRKRIADEKALCLLETIIHSIGGDQECGLPIGNITSQFFANLYLDELDRYVKHNLREQCYLRYMDDVLFFGSSRERLKQLGALIEQFVEGNLKLKLHRERSVVRPFYSRIPFLGFRLFRYRRKVLPATVSRYVRRLNLLSAAYRREEITLEKIANSVECWVSFMSYANTWHIRKEILGRYCY